MNWLITFGSDIYDNTIEKIVSSAPSMGVDRVLVYDGVWLMSQDFYRLNNWLWQTPHKRGFGWYAWKPFILLDAFKRMEEGDCVLYLDADTYPVANLFPLYSVCRRDGAMLFEASAWINQLWCKRDCYLVMGQDEQRYHASKAGVARFMLFQKGPWRPYQFLMEWLTYSINPIANTFDPSKLGPELEGFREHRCEQAILTLLAHKYGYKLHREACQAGDQCGATNDRDLYPTLFYQHDIGRQNEIRVELPSRFCNVEKR